MLALLRLDDGDLAAQPFDPTRQPGVLRPALTLLLDITVAVGSIQINDVFHSPLNIHFVCWTHVSSAA